VSIFQEFIQESRCALHVASNYAILKRRLLHGKTVVSFEQDVVLFSLQNSNVPHSFTNPLQWSKKHDWFPRYLPSIQYKVTSCVSFLLVLEDDSLNTYWNDILMAVEHSGYFIDPAAIFWVLLRQPEGSNTISESFSKWQNRDRFLVSDVTVVFLIETHENGVDVGIFCYICKEHVKFFNRIEEISLARIKHAVQTYHQNLNGAFAAMNSDYQEWWANPTSPIKVFCDPFQYKERFDDFTCWPLGRIILNLLRTHHNFTLNLPPSSDVSWDMLYNPPYFSTKHPIIINPGIS
jgi:hypothetical protein